MCTSVWWSLLRFFEFVLVKKNAQEGIIKFEYFAFWGQKVRNFLGCYILDFTVQSRKYLGKCKYFMKGVYWWNVVYWLGVGLVLLVFLFSKILHSFRWGQSFSTIWDFSKVFKIDIWQRFWQALLQSGDKYQCTDYFGAFLVIKII